MTRDQRDELNYKVFRFMVFIGATLYIFIRAKRALTGFYDSWTPISFFQILPGPLEPIYLKCCKYLWLSFSILAGLNKAFSITSKLALACGVFYLGYEYNFGYVYHSTQVYLCTLFILALAPRDKSGSRAWHLDLAKLWVVYVMLTTGIQKLYYGGGLDWAFSDSFFFKIFNLPHHTPFAQLLLDSPVFYSQIVAVFALVIVELLAPVSLISRRFGILYFFIWTSFHPLVTLLFSSHFQFYSQIFIYSAFLPLSDIILKLPIINNLAFVRPSSQSA